MPIRFRCVYCEKLLGIARRKAGAVVNCPHCNEKLIVPTPEPGAASEADDEPVGTEEEDALAAAAAASKMKLFEHHDFDAMLQGAPTFRANENTNGPPAFMPPPPFVAPPAAAPMSQPVEPSSVPQPLLNRLPMQQGIFVSSSKLMWLSIAFVVVLALTFGAGLMVGRMMK